MRRPVIWCLGFFIFGILLGIYASVFLFVLGFCLGLFLCFFLFKWYRYRPVFIFVLFLLAGAGRVNLAHDIYIEVPYPYVVLHGRVIDIGITGGGNQRTTVRTPDGVRVMAYVPVHLPWPGLGQDISVTGELRPLARAQNPGGYDQFRHLRSQGIRATIWATSVELGETRLTPVVIMRQFRERLAYVYERVLPAREAAVIRSMVLGDRADMDRDLSDQYRTMGIFHILSISGLHVAILMMALNKFIGLFISERRGGLIVLTTMILFCIMTGASVATVRAVTMGGVLVFAKILRRKYDLLAAVSWACMALLLFEPYFLLNVGFQLSFSAVFGIGVLSAPVERLITKLRFPAKLRPEMAVGIAAVAATYPVFGFHMYDIQLYSVLGNLIIAPTTAIILVMGVATGLFGLVWLPAAEFLGGTVFYILRFYDVFSGFFARLPHAMLLVGGGCLVVTGLGFATLLAFAYAFHGFGESFKRRLRLFFMVAAVLVVAAILRYNPPGVHITVLDTAGNYTVLRHRGYVVVFGATRGGESAVLRYLDFHGVHRAHGLFLLEEPVGWEHRRFGDLYESGRFRYVYAGWEQPGVVALNDMNVMYIHGVRIYVTAGERVGDLYFRIDNMGDVVEVRGEGVWVNGVEVCAGEGGAIRLRWGW